MPTISEQVLSRLHHWIERKRVADATPGISLAITDPERVVHTATFGLANIDAGIPVSPDHLFETGSIGKSFTAIALLQLADEGKVDLHAPVTDYLPWFSIRSEHEPIRLHHLLTHTAGITSALDFAPAGRFQVWSLRSVSTTTPPGIWFHYSNIGYKVLGEVIESVTGDTYGPVIQRRILDPLGLRHSSPTITHDIRPSLAVGYGPAYDDRPWWPGRPLAATPWLETDTADGCLAMTAADLASYLRMLLNRGEGPQGRFLTPAAFEKLTQQAIGTPEGSDHRWYGYGVVTRYEDGCLRTIEHGGGMVGYVSCMMGDVQLGLGVTVLMNGPGAPVGMARAILDLLRADTTGSDRTLPQNFDPTHTPHAKDYVGTYRLADQTAPGAYPAKVSVSRRGNAIELGIAVERIALRAEGEDVFVADHPTVDRFPLAFVRDRGIVTGLMHGGAWYVRDGKKAPEFGAPPPDWLAIPGHYRSHNPWTPDIRLALNRGRLWLHLPTEPDGLERLQPLVPVADGSFRCGEDPRIPESIRFDTVIDGRAQRAVLSLCDFYRVNTP